jgi:hypothetical protein
MFDKVNIVLIGKYTDFKDSYTSVVKALEHSAFRVHRKLILQVCGLLLQRLYESHQACGCFSGLNRQTWSLRRKSRILPNTMTRGEP